MPVEKKNVQYGCERCSSTNPNQGEFFSEIKAFARFRHHENNNLIELYMCGQCKSVYIKMGDDFIPGFFINESAMLGSNFA